MLGPVALGFRQCEGKRQAHAQNRKPRHHDRDFAAYVGWFKLAVRAA